MVLNGPTKTGKCPAQKSLNPFIYKQSLCKLKDFSDFLKSGANDGT